MAEVIHVWGFADEDDLVRGVHVARYDGALDQVANGVLAAIDHPKRVTTTRTLDGWLVEVGAVVEVGGTQMWHRFFGGSSEPWPLREVPA